MSVNQIRQMDTDEIRSALEDAKSELFNLRFQREAGTLENTTRIRQLRKNVARYLTILREREIAAALVQQEENNGE
ncbi:MAG: 50S ribosomal protein L29 [Anaerolineae bacterium]|nr:50S ribosomal protein L29 [Anaerolineae bacterium]